MLTLSPVALITKDFFFCHYHRPRIFSEKCYSFVYIFNKEVYVLANKIDF